nr:hypothetical protein Iba_chr03aCG6530 [Ipomoea batatas]
MNSESILSLVKSLRICCHVQLLRLWLPALKKYIEETRNCKDSGFVAKYCGNLICDSERTVGSPILCALGSTNHIDEDFFVIDGDDVVNLGDDSDERFEGE